MREFLRNLARAESSPPNLECKLVRTSVGNLQLSVKLTNVGDQTLWFHMSGLRFSFEARQVRHALSVDWHADDKDNWFPLPPGSVLSGYAMIEEEQIAGAGELTVTLGHHSARFPESAWLGFQTVKLRACSSCETPTRNALARFSHHLTVEARDKPAITSLRLLAVLNVLFKYASARRAARALY